MAENISRLELVWKVRPGGGGKTRRKYLDFVVDGQSLTDLVKTGDFIGCLGWMPEQVEKPLADALLLKQPSELANGRYRIYICPECGDVDCGSITIEIEKTLMSLSGKILVLKTVMT